MYAISLFHTMKNKYLNGLKTKLKLVKIKIKNKNKRMKMEQKVEA